jgi:diguanylate cyclase (GGDEF)-like protein/PAS domain S-box-containing protein
LSLNDDDFLDQADEPTCDRRGNPDRRPQTARSTANPRSRPSPTSDPTAGWSLRELRHQYTRLLAAQREAGIGHFSFNAIHKPGWCSPQFLLALGATRPVSGSDCERRARDIWRRLEPAYRVTLKSCIRQSAGSGRPFGQQLRVLGFDGNFRWIWVRGDCLGQAGNRRISGTVIDMTQQEQEATQAQAREAAHALRREQAELSRDEMALQLQVLAEHCSDLVVIHDCNGRIHDVNQLACATLGYRRDELLALAHHQVDVDLTLERLQKLAARRPAGQRGSLNSHYRRRDGSLLPVEVRAVHVEIDAQPHLLTLVRDLSERNDYEQQVQHLAYFDPLTGLPNRASFSRSLASALERAGKQGGQLALLMIDLDRFKTINDALGHCAGDRLLQEMAHRLRRVLPANAAVARAGGDEFVVLVEDPTDLERLAKDILQALVSEFPLDGQAVYITASIGISTCPEHGYDEFALMKRADIAMYRAKAAGKNTWALYSSQMDLGSVAQLMLESDLRRAIEGNALLLYYQPKVDARSTRITGCEVLVRWQHAQLGMLHPEDFIPIAEETGLIVPLTRWVLRQACLQNRAWQRQGLPALRLAVNLSARQFADDNLLGDVHAILAETGMPATLLELEITESMMMRDTRHAQQMLDGLKRLGVHIALDDFGVAYSSLSHLKRFPIDIIKIDRSFIRGIPGTRADEAITEAIINLSRSLKISVVAEGVEKAEQFQFLRSRSCDEIQGYLFSQPLDADAFSELMLGPRQAAFALALVAGG